MKKMFIAALTAMAMCSYSYAQDDEEYEEEEEETSQEAPQAPAVEEEEAEEEAEAEALTKNDVAAAAARMASGGPTMGISMGFTNQYNSLEFKYKLNPSMELTGIFALYHQGETTTDYTITNLDGTSVSVSTDNGDNGTYLAVGAGFDYYMNMALPISAGIRLIYASNGLFSVQDDDGKNVSTNKVVDESTPNMTTTTETTVSKSDLIVDVLFGVHAEVVKNFVISGKVGFGIDSKTITVENTTTAVAGAVSASSGNNTEKSSLDFSIKAGVFATWYFL